LDNNELSVRLLKATGADTMAFGDAGALTADQVDAFIRLLMGQSNLLKNCQFRKMKSSRYLIETLTLTSDVLRPKTAAVATGYLVHPDRAQRELTANRLQADMDISQETLLNNIEQDGYLGTSMSILMAAIALELERYAFEADATGGVYSADSALSLDDGYFRIAQDEGIVVDWNGAPASQTLFYEMWESLPARFKDYGTEGLVWIMSHRSYDDYVRSLGSIPTTLGDSAIVTDKEFTPMGIPVARSSVIASDLGAVSPYSSADDNLSHILLTRWDNLYWGIQEDIHVQTGTNVHGGVIEIAVPLSAGMEVADPDLMVLAYNVGPYAEE